MHLAIDVGQGRRLRLRWRTHYGRKVIAVDLLRSVLLNKLQDATDYGAGGVLAGHREHALAVNFGLNVGFAQDRVDVLFEEVGLAFFDDEDGTLTDTEAFDFVVDERVGDVENVERNFGVAEGV